VISARDQAAPRPPHHFVRRGKARPAPGISLPPRPGWRDGEAIVRVPSPALAGEGAPRVPGFTNLGRSPQEFGNRGQRGADEGGPRSALAPLIRLPPAPKPCIAGPKSRNRGHISGGAHIRAREEWSRHLLPQAVEGARAAVSASLDRATRSVNAVAREGRGKSAQRRCVNLIALQGERAGAPSHLHE
jgi:hypothetical protein